MSAADLPEKLQRRIAAVEKQSGRRIIVRAARWPEPGLRGRISQRAGAIVLEYRDETAGYFWHIDIVNELLDYVERGYYEVSLTDQPERTIKQPPRYEPED